MEVNTLHKTLEDILNDAEVWELDGSLEEQARATSSKYLLTAIQACVDAGQDLYHCYDSGRNTLVHLAAMWNRLDVLDYLVRMAVDLNETNGLGQTPLDLAMHWCNYDVAGQLVHYGGKHTFEKERDVALAQRDVAQGRINEAVLKMEKALADNSVIQMELEQSRAEKDRAIRQQRELIAEKDQAVSRMNLAEKEREKAERRLNDSITECERLKDQLKASDVSRENAMHGWKLAKQHVLDCDKLKQEALEREAEALRMRDIARFERDAARDLMMQAQEDHAIAVVCEKRASKERDDAVHAKVVSEKQVEKKLMEWSEIVAEAEMDKANIQRIVKSTTLDLREKCRALEEAAQKNGEKCSEATHKLMERNEAYQDLHGQYDQLLRKHEEMERKYHRIDHQLKMLLNTRKQEETELQESIDRELHSRLKGTMSQVNLLSDQLWEHLQLFYAQVLMHDAKTKEGEDGEATTSTSTSTKSTLTSKKSPKHLDEVFVLPRMTTSSPSREQTRKNYSSTAQPTRRCFTADSPSKRLDSLRITLPGENVPPKTDAERRMQKATLWRSWCKQTSQKGFVWHRGMLEKAWSNTLHVLEEMQDYVMFLHANTSTELQRFSQYTAMQKRIIHRKENLIQRFNQHREEKYSLPQESNATKFRDCFVHPMV